MSGLRKAQDVCTSGLKELASKAKCTARYILYLRKGERKNIGIDYVDRMLKALGVSVVLGQKREEP